MTTVDEAATTVEGTAHTPLFDSRSHEEEARAIARLVQRMVARFPEIPAQRVEDVVSSAHQGFADARVRHYVPLLVEHDVLIELKLLAGASRPVAGHQTKPVQPSS